VLRIGVHFNFPDPALDVPIARDPKGDITSPSATVRRYGVPPAADWGHGESSLAARRVKDQPT
jgi:hypothetical protein